MIPPGLSPERAAAIAPNPGTLPCSFGHVAELWLSGKLATAFPGRVRPKQNYDSTRSALSHVLPILSRLPCRAFTLDQGEAALSSIPTRLGPAYTRTIARTVRQLLGFAVYPLRWIETNPLPSQWVPRSEVSLERQILMPSEEHAIIACTSIPLYLRVFVAWQARQGTRYIDAARMTLASITFQHDKAIVTLAQTKDNDPRSWALSADDTAMIRAWIEWRRAHGERLRQSSPLFISARGMRLVNSNLAMWIRTAAWEAGIRRAALFSRSAHSWPHEEHDLRALFCTYALAKCRPLSWITDRTGHSLHSLGAYQRPARRWAEAELGDLAPSNRAIPEIAAICGLDPLPSPTLTTQPGDMTVRPTTIFPPRRLVSAQVLAQSGTPCGRREKLISASNQVVLTMPLAAAKRSPVGAKGDLGYAPYHGDPPDRIAPIAPLSLLSAPLPPLPYADTHNATPIAVNGAAAASDTGLDAIRLRLASRACAADEVGDHESARQWLAALAALPAPSPAQSAQPLALPAATANVIPMRRNRGAK